MGIDMYLNWKDMGKEEKEAQYCGFDIRKGNVGYLREAYHGSPYATHALAPECWQDEQPEDGVLIPAATLRARLPIVLETAKLRAEKVYNDNDEESIKETQQSFIDFVELAEKKEAETGEPCRVYASY